MSHQRCEYFPKIYQDYRRFPKTFERDPKMSRSRTIEFKYNLKDKLDISEATNLLTCEDIWKISHPSPECGFVCLNINLSLYFFLFRYRFVSISWYTTPQAEIVMYMFVEYARENFVIHVTTVHLVLWLLLLSFIIDFFSCVAFLYGSKF